MVVYRYENPDGGGPWFYKDGRIRFPLPQAHLYDKTTDYIYGCKTKEELFNYFLKQKVNLENCKIKVYNIPKEDVIDLGKQVIFPKKYIE